MKNITTVIFLLGIVIHAHSQTPTDDLMMNKGQICIATLYEHGTWNQYWEGKYLRGNQNIGTLTRQMVMPMVAFGITDKFNLIVGLPYVRTEASGGNMDGAKGIQDISLSLKNKWLEKEVGKGKMSLFTNLSYNTPFTNYLSDYLPFSIGLGTQELGARAIAAYRLNRGLYFRGSMAYLWRGQTEAEKAYYYNNGSYYTTFMDVPNAMNYNLTVGHWFLKNRLRVETTYANLYCLSGDDIRSYNMGQPTNKMDFAFVGGFAQYYLQNAKNLGIIAYYNHFVNGRNMGKFNMVGIGLNYQFQLIAQK